MSGCRGDQSAVAVRRSKFSSYICSFILDGLRGFGQPLHLEPLGGLEELRQLVLRHVHLASVHELQDCGQMVEWDVLHTGKTVNSEVQLEFRLIIYVRLCFICIYLNVLTLNKRIENSLLNLLFTFKMMIGCLAGFSSSSALK